MIELVLLIIITVMITGVLLAAVIEAALAADRWSKPRYDGRVASLGQGLRRVGRRSHGRRRQPTK